MPKRNRLALWLLALGFLLAGCQLAQPGLTEAPQPVGIWLEAGEAGAPPAAGYAPTVDFDAPGAIGLILQEEATGPDGEPVRTYGRAMSRQFLDIKYGSHVTASGERGAEDESSFSGTLYLSLEGDAPEAFWLWRVCQGEDGALYTQGQPEEIRISHAQLEQGGTYSNTFSFETTAGPAGGAQQSVKQTYTVGFQGIGKLSRVRILEFDQDFERLACVELEIQDGDEYRTRADAAYAAIEETYVENGREKAVCSAYSADEAIDYDGEQALYHTLKYMGETGIVQPRGLKLVFTGR